MSKKATEFQKREMSKMYRGKEIFKPLNTGWVDERVACVREWVANIFFYRKGDTTIMIDAGYNYDRLAEKMDWLGIDPQSIHIFYALKMGEKYRERYERHFATPVIHEQNLQHEELLACYPERWAQLVKDIMEGKR